MKRLHRQVSGISRLVVLFVLGVTSGLTSAAEDETIAELEAGLKNCKDETFITTLSKKP